MTASADIWAGTSGPRDAEIVICGEAQGAEERDAGRPFVGTAGRILDGLLAESGIDRAACFLTNVVNERPPGNDLQQWFGTEKPTLGGLSPGPQVLAGLASLNAQLNAVRPKVVLAFGNYALWALTRHAGSVADGPRSRTPSGILEWRGSQVYRVDANSRTAAVGSGTDTAVPVLPLVHPAAIGRDWALRWPTAHDLRTRVPLALAGRWARADRDPPYNFVCGTNFDATRDLLSSWLRRADEAATAAAAAASAVASAASFEISCDIETWRASLITCIGLATDSDSALSIPLVRLDAGRKGAVTSFWAPAEEAELTRLLGRLLSHPAIGWVGQNFLYDRAFLWDWWRVEPRLAWDTLVAQNLLLPGTQKDLGYLSSLYCRHHRFWKRDSRDWTDDVGGEGLETHLLYNAEDTARTFEIAQAQRQALAEIEPDRTVYGAPGRLRLWGDELEKIGLAWEMQRRGIAVNSDKRGVLAMQLIEARSALAAWLETLVPQAVCELTPASGTRWYDSPKQTMWILYDLFGLRLQRNRKTGALSSDDEAVATLGELYPRLGGLFEALLEYRSLGVLFSTFVEAKLESDGKMHSAFNPAGTETFRFSSSKNPFKRGGNMQNVPGTEDV